MKRNFDLNTLKRLIKFLFTNYKGYLFIIICCIIINALSSVAATAFLQQLIDSCITPGIEGGFEGIEAEFIRILSTMALIYVVGVFCSFLYTRLLANVTQGTLKKLRDAMYTKMQKLPISYFDTHAHGDIMSTYTNDTDALRQFVGQSLPSLISSLLTITSIVVMMLYYSLWLSLVVALFIFIMLQVTGSIGSKSSQFMLQQQQSLAKEEGFIEEMMNGLKVVKVFTHEAGAKADFDQINEQLFNDSESANRFGNVLQPILNNVGNLMYVTLSLIGGLLVYFKVYNISLSLSGTISIGVIVSFLSMARQLSQTLGQFSSQMAMIAMGIAGSTRVFALIDEEVEADEGYVELVNACVDEGGNYSQCDKKTGLWAWKHPHHKDGSITYTPLKGDIVMDHVDFSYDGQKQVLNDISLYAKPGQKIAFVGATGAGKTTITNLINRFYDIDDGKIRYDGININKIKKSDLRKSLGIVLQDVNLFTGTVMDNIRYGRLDATDEECIAAAKLANADGFISRLPDGYQTLLANNGAALSQGQRQLISIARAAVADPPVMILDEATSSIDTRTEALVQKGMDNLMKGRTVFVIAHRLSTVRNSDAIMVLDHGAIIERGDHDDLLAQKGVYYRLYTGAFELE